jgi:hypothetical protein
VLFDTGPSLVCLVDGIRVRIPTSLIESGSEVRRNGDHGRLVIPKWLALSVGLTCSPLRARRAKYDLRIPAPR